MFACLSQEFLFQDLQSEQWNVHSRFLTWRPNKCLSIFFFFQNSIRMLSYTIILIIYWAMLITFFVCFFMGFIWNLKLFVLLLEHLRSRFVKNLPVLISLRSLHGLILRTNHPLESVKNLYNTKIPSQSKPIFEFFIELLSLENLRLKFLKHLSKLS